uniref:Reverse transcriptase domain-containing protein n=1 Tax=Triticum urartu TaxID=4572 RepID=A0A8R7TYP0_TRIUA
MKKFRPICLSNCSVKIFSKAMTNRVSPVGRRLLSPCQSAFVRGKFILESVVTAHEGIHE